MLCTCICHSVLGCVCSMHSCNIKRGCAICNVYHGKQMHVQRACVAIIYFYQVRRSARLKSFSQNISPKLKLENSLIYETGKENTHRPEFQHPIF